MVRTWWRILLVALTSLALVYFIAVIVANTELETSGQGWSDGELSVGLEFPRLDCRKVLFARFPYVRFDCQEKEPVP